MQNIDHPVNIKALGPDNRVQVRNIVKLFEKAYGQSFPLQCVYDPQYWSTHIGARFYSLIAEIDGKVIGHIALYPDPHHRDNIQACLPAIDPGCFNQLERIGVKLRSLLSDLKTRQNWNMLYFFVLARLPGFETLAQNFLQTREVALLPGYFPDTGFRARGQRQTEARFENRLQVSVTQQVFQNNIQAQQTIYVPEMHASILSFLYSSIGLQPNIIAANYCEASLKQHYKEELTKGLSAIRTTRFATTRMSHIFVEPCLLKSKRELKQAINNNKDFKRFVFLNASDPLCPETSICLEELDYRFGGVIPLLKGKNYLVYFDNSFPLSGLESGTSPGSQLLAEYIKSYSDNSQANNRLCGPAKTNSFAAPELRFEENLKNANIQ